MKTIQDFFTQLVSLLTPIYGAGEARSIARIVFEDAFQLFDFASSKPFLYTEQFKAIQQRLCQQEPVQYVLGQADFYGLKFKVTPAVLIPRSETEELVHWILETNQLVAPRILDIGTGSGCIPITLKKKLPQSVVTATDISPAALAIAQENAINNEVTVSFLEQNILQTAQWSNRPSYDIIISNPPYIPTKEAHLMPTWVKDFEPDLALFVSNDQPLLFYRTIAEFALLHLAVGGRLFFETNEFNAPAVATLLSEKGFDQVVVAKDMYGKERMVKGSL